MSQRKKKKKSLIVILDMLLIYVFRCVLLCESTKFFSQFGITVKKKKKVLSDLVKQMGPV